MHRQGSYRTGVIQEEDAEAQRLSSHKKAKYNVMQEPHQAPTTVAELNNLGVSHLENSQFQHAEQCFQGALSQLEHVGQPASQLLGAASAAAAGVSMIGVVRSCSASSSPSAVASPLLSSATAASPLPAPLLSTFSTECHPEGRQKRAHHHVQQHLGEAQAHQHNEDSSRREKAAHEENPAADNIFHDASGVDARTNILGNATDDDIQQRHYLGYYSGYDEGMHAFCTPYRIMEERPASQEEGEGDTNDGEKKCSSDSVLPYPESNRKTAGFGSQHKAATVVLYNIGQSLLLRKKDDQAFDHFIRAMALARQPCSAPSDASASQREEFAVGPPPQHSIVPGACGAAISGTTMMIAILHNIGYIQYRNNEHDKALATFHEALALCRKQQKELELEEQKCEQEHNKDQGVMSEDNKSSDTFLYESVEALLNMAATLNCLGVLHFHMPTADATGAMRYFQQAMGFRKQILRTGSNASVVQEHSFCVDLATLLNNIGRVHYIEGEFPEALSFYHQALEIRRRVLGAHHLDVGATICNAGQTHQQMGAFTRALEYYQEFMSITVPQLGASHPDVAMMVKCMAQIYHEERDFPRALALYQQALDTTRRSLGLLHPEVASIYNKMGNLYYEMGVLGSAIVQYQQGLAVERVVLNKFHPNVVVTLTNIGQIYKQQGNNACALGVYQEALELQRETLGPTHPNIAVTMSNIGLIHYQMRSYPEALDIYQEALRIRRDLFGEDHLDVASSMNSIGLVLFKLGLYDLALESFNASLRIRRALLGSVHRDVAIILYNIATVHLERGEDDEAMKCYKETLHVERACLGEDHGDVILTLQYIAQVHQQRGEFHEALECLLEVLSIHRRRRALDNRDSDKDNKEEVELAQTLNGIANFYLQLGDAVHAMEAMSEATRIMRRVGSQEEELQLSGFQLYEMAKTHPESAAAA